MANAFPAYSNDYTAKQTPKSMKLFFLFLSVSVIEPSLGRDRKVLNSGVE